MKVLRRIGPGDREFVRGRVLSIAFVSPHRLDEQLLVGIRVALKLGMILRAHYRIDRVPPQVLSSITTLFQQNPEQKLREHEAQSFEEFVSTAKAFELVVLFDAGDSPSMLYDELMNCWFNNHQRFLNGNFAQTSHEQLLKQYPQFDWDLTEAYTEFNK